MTVFYREWLGKRIAYPAAFQLTQNQLKEKYSVFPYSFAMGHFEFSG